MKRNQRNAVSKGLPRAYLSLRHIHTISSKYLNSVVSRAGFEPATH